MNTPMRPSILSLIGQVLDGRYRITEALGEGGMGAVYRAEQIAGPTVAVKVLREELGDNQEIRERFEREARALFALEHPNILTVHDFGIVQGNPYLVMELLEGLGLDAYLEQHTPTPEQAIAIARQILTGLAFAHQQGVLHRDLKSENVFLKRESDGTMVAKLLDFGLVKFVDDDRWGESKKLTVQGSVFGTPAYMAPEQCTGAPSDARTDVYAMGCILFELLTGLWPFMEENQMMMFRAHLMQAPPTLSETHEDYDFAPELEAVVAKALGKKPADRFANAMEMLAALTAVPARPYRRKGSGAAGIPPTPSAGVPLPPPPRAHVSAPLPATRAPGPLAPPPHATEESGKGMLPLVLIAVGLVVVLVIAAGLFLLFA